MKTIRTHFWSVFLTTLLLLGGSQVASADAIPYPTSGVFNPVSYTFTAASTGHIIAYIVGGYTAGYENEMGLRVNGVLTSAGFGLNNHASAATPGISFDLGAVNAGDSLVFVLHNLTLGMDAYSDSSLNASYDFPSWALPHNHIYSTPYTATSPVFPSFPSGTVPPGTYVAFEDLQFPGSDFNYNDESFVFTNTITTTVPEPSSFALLGIGIVGMLGYALKQRQFVRSAK